MYSRESCIERCRFLPQLGCHVVLTLVEIQVAQQVACIGVIRECRQCAHCLRSVRETEVNRLACCLNLVFRTPCQPCYIIIGERSGCTFLYGHVPQAECPLCQSCRYIVKGKLVVVVGVATHQFLHLRHTSRLIQYAVVERIKSQRFLCKGGIVALSCHSQQRYLKSPCLMVVPSVYQRLVNVTQRIFIITSLRSYLRTHHVARLLPCGIPR